MSPYSSFRLSLLGAAAFAMVCVASAPSWAGDRKPRSVKRKLTQRHLGRGQTPSSASQSYVRRIGCRLDDAGHIIGKRLGGGGNISNMFPQNRSINRGAFAQWEKKIAKLLGKKSGRTYVYKFVEVEVRFGFGNSKRPKRPTQVRYKYQAYLQNGRKDTSRAGRGSRTFGNPVEKPCQQQQWSPGFKQLAGDIAAHLRTSKSLRRFETRLEDSYVGYVCSKDIERDGDREAKMAERYRKAVAAKVKPKYAGMVAARNVLLAKIRPHLNTAATKAVAHKALTRLRNEGATLARAMTGTAGGDSQRTRAARSYNKTKFNTLQNKLKCNIKNDGKGIDCGIYHKCVVYEILPRGSKNRSLKQAAIQGKANRLNASHRKSRPGKWLGGGRGKGCWDKNGPTNGAGILAHLRTYSGCRR